MAYPSVITGFTNPLATQRLNAPSHSGIETAQNTDLTAIETFLGTEGNTSTLGTLIYDVRSAGSGGGGHVQTAVLGGTGQVTYTKGDILVATSPSVLTKLAVGSDNQVLTVNSSVAAGINWVNGVNTNVRGGLIVQTATSVATSVQTFAHGLGVIPNLINFYATAHPTDGGVGAFSASQGFFVNSSPSVNAVVSQYSSTLNAGVSSRASSILAINIEFGTDGNTRKMAYVSSVNTGSVLLVWTTGGTPAGDNINIAWTAQK